MTTTTNDIHHCTECGQMKPVTDWRGHSVLVDCFEPRNAAVGGADTLIKVAVDDRRNGDRMTPMMLTPEMADRLVVVLASEVEALRQFRLETQS